MITTRTLGFALGILAWMAAIEGNGQSTYFKAVTNLAPAGYWPMHEMETAAVGDIETNYGTLGPLGNGYYPDWAVNLGAFVHQMPGALAGDSDTATYFTYAGAANSGTITNAMYIPHTSPLSTLNPPFSVECWYYASNSAHSDYYVWSQSGYEGLNAGGGYGAGGGNVCGIQLYWGPAQMSVQYYDNSSAVTAFNVNDSFGQWVHLVVTCDAFTNLSVYVNGYISGSSHAAAGHYSPDYWTPFELGNGRGSGRAAQGIIDQVAIYTTNLAASDILAHYQAGTNPAPATAYSQLVTNDSPVIYLRMDGPAYSAPSRSTWPALTNYGSVAANGVYSPGTFPGIASGPVNPLGEPYYGLGISNVAQLSGVSSFADAGYASAYNPTGTTPFSVSAVFHGNPTDTRTNSIVGHSDNSWRTFLNTSGRLQCQLGTNTSSAITSSGVYNDGNWHQLVEVYTPASNPDVTGTNALYVDGALDTSVSTVSTNGIGPGSPMDVLIGSDPQYTNNIPGLGRQFAGQVCEVAVFTNSLTSAQISALYNALEIGPYIVTQPAPADVGAGNDFTNTVVARGSSLAYQWYTNGVALAAQTNASLILNPAVPADTATDYYVIITNDYGSVTSSIVSITVLSAPTIESYSPVPYTNPFTLFAGASPTLSVSVLGNGVNYQWYTNGVGVAGATNASFALTNVQVSFTNDYCIITNNFGSTTSIVWSASAIADPTYPYPATVLSANPVGYWRLDEQAGDVCHDYVGGNDGIYTNVTLGNSPGYSSTDPETCVAFGLNGLLPVENNFAGQIQNVNFSAPTGTTTNFTVEAWVNQYEPNNAASSILSEGVYNVNDTWSFDFDTSSSHFYRFYVRTANGSVVTCTSALPADTGNWHHLVGVCDESDGVVNFYIDGRLATNATVGTTAGAYSPDGNPMQIGSAQSAIGGDYTEQYFGYVNDVAVYNYALSSNEVAAQFDATTNVAPYFTETPSRFLTVSAGTNLTIPAALIGTPSLSYQWTDTTTESTVATGTTNGAMLNASLTVNNVPASWNGNTLQLSANNSYGSTNASVLLTVVTTPELDPNLPAQITVKSGQNYTYSIGATGPGPFSYKWYNAGSQIANQTNATYAVTGASGSTTYYVVVANSYGSVTSVISTLVVVPTPTNAYAQSILNLNPSGYWPMHEVEGAAPGDVEINYGTLGLLGTGYYPDWAGGSGTNAFERQVAGALFGDPDTATYFDYTGGDNSGSTANALYVPHTSPLSTLNPPFTVECWFNANSGHNEECIWGQSGYEGLNAGASGAGNGAVCGIQLYTGPAQTSIQMYNNSNSVTGYNQNITLGVWNHFVVACDANTNLYVYINGALSGTNAAAGKYSPDYWTPFEVGDSRGNTRAFDGAIDEVAVYTTNLAGTDIATHYNDGISGAEGAYFHDVTNDNPVIYLRMDAPSYIAPAPATCPPLLNFGTAGDDGIYSPGTAPGIVAGPTANGTPLGALPGATVPQLSGVSSYGDAGYAATYNPTGANPFSVIAMFRGNPCDNRVQAIVGHSDNSWSILMNTNGTLQSQLGTNTASQVNSVGVYNDGNWHQLADVYAPASNPTQTGTHYLYVDGALDSSVGTVSTNGIGPGSTMDVIIGGDPEYTNNPAGVGRQFAGQVCEVALFNSALTAAQVNALYKTAVTGTNFTVNTGPTTFGYSVSNGVLTLTWPSAAIGWQLQAQTNNLSVGLSTNWFNVANTQSTNQVVIPMSLTNGAVFYRLAYP
ncbi:MAG TPA: LamG-like jellyroll fold domain-containing protein [Candidatus Sulfotelmatobacter sp.]|nr:LamG-like jellyroll fold domain-containing protein [Candidatus Sulfotelmatobacter sp.]